MPPLELSPEEEGLYLPDPSEYEVEAYEPQQYGRGSFFEPLAGLQNLEMPRPQSFGEGLIQGLGRGLGTSGSRAAQRRQMFEQEQTRRQAMNDQERLAASRQLRTDTGAGRRALAGEQARRRRENEQYERDTAAVDQEALKEMPWLSRVMDAKGRVPKSLLRGETESERKRNAAVASRESRAEAREVRAQNTAELGAYDKMQANYANEPAVKAYTGVRSNLMVAESGAKERSGPGDIALIYSWHRALEPDKPNVVREGDVALTREAISQLQKVYTIPGKFFSGQQLTDVGRQYFLRQMRNALKAREPDYKATNEQYRSTMGQFGVDPGQVIRDVTPQAAIKAKGQKFVRP